MKSPLKKLYAAYRHESDPGRSQVRDAFCREFLKAAYIIASKYTTGYAEDIAHDVALKVLRDRPAIDDIDRWMRVAIKNRYLDTLRKKVSQTQSLDDARYHASLDPNPDLRLEGRELQVFFEELKTSRNPREQQILQYLMLGLSPQEIASEINVEPAYTRTLISRLRKKLRLRLGRRNQAHYDS